MLNTDVKTGNNDDADVDVDIDRQVSELMVSSYDPVMGKTIWQCAQCHYSSKTKYTVSTVCLHEENTRFNQEG